MEDCAMIQNTKANEASGNSFIINCYTGEMMTMTLTYWHVQLVNNICSICRYVNLVEPVLNI
jgi:hypothetical protein